MYVFKRQLEARGHLEGARHLDGGRRLETGRRASSLVRSRDIAFGSGQGVHALSIPHLRYLRHSSYAPVAIIRWQCLYLIKPDCGKASLLHYAHCLSMLGCFLPIDL